MAGTDYRSLYDREYLGSWDLPEGKDVVVTIESVKGGELVQPGGRKNKKPIIAFVGKDKRFVSNKTNSKAIAGMYGNHVEKWVGKKIALYVSTTRDPSTGDDIPCIRVRPQVPPSKPSSSSPSAESSAPAEEASSGGTI